MSTKLQSAHFPVRARPANYEGPDEVRTLIDEYLAQQQQLQTPVVRAAEAKNLFDTAVSQSPALEPLYRDLIPLSKPSPGQQYAFEVDLDACSGCKACVAGCHSLNGLDENETWRDVGLLLSPETVRPFQQTVTTACHHCADPGCLNGCPVLAYEKDPITGIVVHLDDQCIGCSYCVLKCPYDVPKFNERLGIVRKCDMCHGRLEAGEAPACVQACPTQAIRIVTVDLSSSETGPRVGTDVFLQAAPDPSFTQPTTRYVSRRPLPLDLRASDQESPRVQPAHTPLAALLLFTQIALGLQFTALIQMSAPVFRLGGLDSRVIAAWTIAALGLGASALHLGQPLRAWRVFLGLRRSWLSREAIVLGIWFGALSLQLTLPWIERFIAFESLPITQAVSFGGLILGSFGIFCSAMIYIDTPRRAWSASRTLPKFAGTIALAAFATTSPILAAATLLLKLVVEILAVRSGPKTTKILLAGPLRTLSLSRLSLAVLGIAAFVGSHFDSRFVAIAWILTLAGEFIERRLFFLAVDPSKMPGVPSLVGLAAESHA